MAKDVATFQSNKSRYPIPFGQAHHHSVGLSTYDMYIYVYTYVYIYIIYIILYIYIIVCSMYVYAYAYTPPWSCHYSPTILSLLPHSSITQVEAKLYNWGDYNRYSVQAVGKHTTWRAGSGGRSASCVLARRWKGANWTQKKKQTLNGGCDTRKNSDAGKLQEKKRPGQRSYSERASGCGCHNTIPPMVTVQEGEVALLGALLPGQWSYPHAIVIPIIKIDYFVQS